MKTANSKTLKIMVMVCAFAMCFVTAFASGPDFDSVAAPIIDLINALVNPALAIVGALGTLFCIILGVKYAKAEEPQEREKAKSHLKNAIIGFVLIFVLILVLKLSMGILEDWVADQIANSTTELTI